MRRTRAIFHGAMRNGERKHQTLDRDCVPLLFWRVVSTSQHYFGEIQEENEYGR